MTTKADWEKLERIALAILQGKIQPPSQPAARTPWTGEKRYGRNAVAGVIRELRNTHKTIRQIATEQAIGRQTVQAVSDRLSRRTGQRRPRLTRTRDLARRTHYLSPQQIAEWIQRFEKLIQYKSRRLWGYSNSSMAFTSE